MTEQELRNHINKIVRHFKGDLYLILSLDGEDTETGEILVTYRALYGDCKLYHRKLSMFLSKVDRDKYPYVEQEYRFEPITIESNKPIFNKEIEDRNKKNTYPVLAGHDSQHNTPYVSKYNWHDMSDVKNIEFIYKNNTYYATVTMDDSFTFAGLSMYDFKSAEERVYNRYIHLDEYKNISKSKK